MAKKIDFTRPPAAQFNTPPAAQAAGGIADQPFSLGHTPLPIGKPMVIKNPTPGERAILEELGWKPGDPVPENLHEAIARAQAATDLDQMPPPVPLDTPPVRIVETDIRQLPPDKQAHYRQAMEELLRVSGEQFRQAQELREASEGLGEGVGEAARLAGELSPRLDVVDDRQEATYDSGMPKEPPPAEPPAAGPALRNCPYCGFELASSVLTEPTEGDKYVWLQSLLSLQPFVKTTELYSGRVKVAIRSLTSDEADACMAQAAADMRAEPWIDGLARLQRYRTALQIYEIHGLAADIVLAKRMKDWAGANDKEPLKTIWAHFTSQLDNETLLRMLLGATANFNQLVHRLEANSNNPDFWPAVGDSAS